MVARAATLKLTPISSVAHRGVRSINRPLDRSGLNWVSVRLRINLTLMTQRARNGGGRGASCVAAFEANRKF